MRASDVTWIKCANRDDVEQLPPAARRCLFHEVHAKLPLPNGTRSLALKHLLAYRAIRERQLPPAGALVMEDDANPPPATFELLQLPYNRPPPDSDVFFLGGGAKHVHMNTHEGGRFTPFVHPIVNATCMHADPWGSYKPPRCVHRRRFDSDPKFVGAHAYIMSRRGAEAMRGFAVRGPADLSISSHAYLCWTTRDHTARGVPKAELERAARHPKGHACHMLAQYAPPRWWIHQRLPLSDDGSTHTSAPPGTVANPLHRRGGCDSGRCSLFNRSVATPITALARPSRLLPSIKNHAAAATGTQAVHDQAVGARANAPAVLQRSFAFEQQVASPSIAMATPSGRPIASRRSLENLLATYLKLREDDTWQVWTPSRAQPLPPPTDVLCSDVWVRMDDPHGPGPSHGGASRPNVSMCLAPKGEDHISDQIRLKGRWWDCAPLVDIWYANTSAAVARAAARSVDDSGLDGGGVALEIGVRSRPPTHVLL